MISSLNAGMMTAIVAVQIFSFCDCQSAAKNRAEVRIAHSRSNGKFSKFVNFRAKVRIAEYPRLAGNKVKHFDPPSDS